MQTKEPVLLTILIDTARMRWLAGGIGFDQQVFPLLASLRVASPVVSLKPAPPSEGFRGPLQAWVELLLVASLLLEAH